MAYVPPHRRRSSQRPQQPQHRDTHIVPRRCGPRCQQWLQERSAAYCPHHAYLAGEVTQQIAEALSQSTRSSFRRWSRTRQEAETNRFVQKRFASKRAEPRRRSAAAAPPPKPRYDSTRASLWPLFNRFLRYAVEAPTLWANELTLWIGGFVFLCSGLYGMQQRSHIRIFLLYDALTLTDSR